MSRQGGSGLRLPSDQRRLRHLRAVGARNLSMGKDGELFRGFFTLHREGDGQEVYRSEMVSGTANPTWRNVDRNAFKNTPCFGSNRFTVRVWRQPEEGLVPPGGAGAGQPVQVLAWDLDLYGLQFIRRKVRISRPVAALLPSCHLCAHPRRPSMR